MTNLVVLVQRVTEMKATATTITTEKGGGAVEVGMGIVKETETESGKGRIKNGAGAGKERIESKYTFQLHCKLIIDTDMWLIGEKEKPLKREGRERESKKA